MTGMRSTLSTRQPRPAYTQVTSATKTPMAVQRAHRGHPRPYIWVAMKIAPKPNANIGQMPLPCP